MQRVGEGLHFRHIFMAQVYSLVTDNHRFYKQQPVQSVICGPAIRAQIQFVNECCTSATRLIFTQTNEIPENRDVQSFPLIIYFVS